MVEAVGLSRDEAAGQWVGVLLLGGGFLLFLVQLPAVIAHTAHFSPYTYIPGVLAFFVGLWKKADHIAMLAGFWLSLFFMIDVFYGISLFA
jgi:hypothetical protein